MTSLTKEKRYDMMDAFNSTSRYLADLLNIDYTLLAAGSQNISH